MPLSHRKEDRDALYRERDKVSRLQAALADATSEMQGMVNWATSNDRITKGEAERITKKLARWQALSTALLPSEWKRAVETHGAPVRR